MDGWMGGWMDGPIVLPVQGHIGNALEVVLLVGS